MIYIHSQGMSHGDLKGVRVPRLESPSILSRLYIKANILIDDTGHARIADFGLLTIISDPTNVLPSSSYTQGGTARWMGPELIDPQHFGLENSRPTKSSDCYAFGMVIYETITGHLPFHKHADLTVFVNVLKDIRPPREAGFADSLWGMLEQCWAPQPSTRPKIEDILQCLESVSQSSEPRSPGIDGEVDSGGDLDSTSDPPGAFSLISSAMPRGLSVFLSLAPCKYISVHLQCITNPCAPPAGWVCQTSGHLILLRLLVHLSSTAPSSAEVGRTGAPQGHLHTSPPFDPRGRLLSHTLPMRHAVQSPRSNQGHLTLP